LPSDWTPIIEFKGLFNGNGKTITTTGTTKFEIDNSNNTVHGILCNYNKGTITNFNLVINELTTYATSTNKQYYHKGTYTVYNGGIAGINHGDIDNVTVIANKRLCNDRNNSAFGVITGLNHGTISNCTVNVKEDVYSTGDAGGIAGRSNGTISNCTFTGKIGIYVSEDNGGETIRSWGGIVGYAYGGTIKNCKNVKAEFHYHGENDMYHKKVLGIIHSKCNLQIKVGVIIGHKENNTTMTNCEYVKDSNKLHLDGGDFHNGSHEKKYLFANENGKIGKIG
ncbi:MAG TPA: hypothetical protein GXZ48_04065, partial [Acholeplasmataceae bacterium]|nr:hypothetical protein [Acholeplasmataceae bacterium]